MPEWYPLLRAAKYLGVPPWELMDRPVWWQRIALAAEEAEHAAEAKASKKGGGSSADSR